MRALPARPPGDRVRPGHVPHPAHRQPRLARAARGADRRPAPSAASGTCAPCSVRRPPPSPTPRRCSPGTAPASHHADQAPGVAQPAVEHGSTRVADRARPAVRATRAARSGTRSPARWWSTSGSSAPSRCSRRTPPPAWSAPPTRSRSGSPGQLELAQLDASRTRLMEAEVRALRAQISPHFIYNSLGAIASLRAHRPRPGPRAAAGVRRLHPLLVPPPRRVHDARRGAAAPSSATCCSSRPGSATGSRSRCGSRPRCCRSPYPSCASSRSSRTPSGTGSRARRQESGTGHIRIVARDLDQECVIEVEDDGVGEDPEKVRRALAGDAGLDSVGLGNVDGRLRNAFGDDYGLVVETAPGRRHQGDRAGAQVRAGGARHEHRPPLLRVLVIDDERPALDELAFLLERDQRVGEVLTSDSGDRGAAAAAGPRRRRGLPRHPDARADRARPGAGAGPVPDAAAGRVRDRARGARRRRVRPARGRLRAQAGPRGPPRRGGTPGGRGRRPADRPTATSRSRSSAAA